MEYRTLELNIASAKDLKNVNLFTKMEVYAVVSLSGDPVTSKKFKTSLDKEGGKNPTWNFPIKLTVNQSLARQNRLILEIMLRCARVLSDKDIGSVHVPLKELLDHTGDGKSFQHLSYQVRKPSGKPKGSLNFSYKFGDSVAAPVKARPPKVAPPPTAAAASASAPYPPPPPAGYPAQGQGGYPYPPPQRNKPGMGLGLGLLGGLLIGDMISDIGDAGAYDVGGFDF